MPKLLFLALALVLLAGCTEPQAVESTLAVENLRLIQERNGTQTVRGVVRNDGGRERSVQLEISLFGTDNRHVGSVHVPVERIPAGSIKGFDWSLDVDVKGVRLRRIVTF